MKSQSLGGRPVTAAVLASKQPLIVACSTSMTEFVMFLLVAVPVAWFASEFQTNRLLRIALGAASLGLSFLVAWAVGSMSQFNYNIWYGAASKDLVDNTVVELKNGKVELVIAELEHLSEGLQPTYENRARYDELVDEYTHAISDSPVRTSR